MHPVELAIGALFAVGGALSVRRWLRVEFQTSGLSERFLYALHVTARVGMWFAFAGFFVGYAVVEDTEAIRWYFLVPVALAGVQLLTTVLLGSSSKAPPAER